MSTTISIEEAKADLSHLIALAQAGHEVIIQDGEKGQARLVSISESPSAISAKRLPGLGAGTVWMSDDFDAPLSDSFWLGKDA